MIPPTGEDSAAVAELPDRAILMSELSESLSSTVMSPDAWRGMVTVLLLVSTVYPSELEVGVAVSCVTISPALESVVAMESGSGAVGVARAASTGMLTMATSRGGLPSSHHWLLVLCVRRVPGCVGRCGKARFNGVVAPVARGPSVLLTPDGVHIFTTISNYG